MKSVKFISNQSGYTFVFGNSTIAEGEYTDDGFEVIDDDEFSTFSNAMQALHYLNMKYARHLYERVSLHENYTLKKGVSVEMLQLATRRM